ncbi:MAG: trigger factor [Aureispira sp.]
MPTIKHENVDELNAIITVELTKEDYLTKVNQKLKKYRKEAQIKGFRPGKVPMSLIKRKFGNAVLVEEINEALGTGLDDYFKEEKLRVLGNPIAIEDKNLNFQISKPENYEFKFEVGFAPEFEVAGVSLDNKLPFYDITVTDEAVTEEIDKIRRKSSTGFQNNITDVQEEDMLAIRLDELDGEGNLKEDGVVKEETFLALRDLANDQLKDDLLTATVGDSFDFDIYTIEAKDEAYIRKHVLGLEEDKEINSQFRLTIKEVKRVAKAELNQAFFKQLFPDDEIEDVDAFKEKVKGEIYKTYKQGALNHFNNLVFDFLMENNNLDLPVEFLKKWLKERNPEITADFFEGDEYSSFIRNTSWSLIRENLAEKYQVEVTYQDIENMTRTEILNYFNYQIPPYGEMMDNMLERVLSDKKEVNKRFESLMDQRILEKTSEDMGKEMIDSTKEEFEAVLKTYQESKNPSIKEEVASETDHTTSEEEE